MAYDISQFLPSLSKSALWSSYLSDYSFLAIFVEISFTNISLNIYVPQASILGCFSFCMSSPGLKYLYV